MPDFWFLNFGFDLGFCFFYVVMRSDNSRSFEDLVFASC